MTSPRPTEETVIDTIDNAETVEAAPKALHPREKPTRPPVSAPVAKPRTKKRKKSVSRAGSVSRASTPTTPAGGEKKNKAQESVSLLLSDNRDATMGKPYHENGNPLLYTQSNMAKRAKCKENKAVTESIERFTRLFTVNGDYIPKESYLHVHARLCKVLRPELSSDEVRQLGEEDWEGDIGADDQLHSDRLREILFEFVDIWTQGVEPAEYMLFLDELAYRLTA